MDDHCNSPSLKYPRHNQIHYVLQKGSSKSVIYSDNLLRMLRRMNSNRSIESIYHPLDMDFHCIFHSPIHPHHMLNPKLQGLCNGVFWSADHRHTKHYMRTSHPMVPILHQENKGNHGISFPQRHPQYIQFRDVQVRDCHTTVLLYANPLHMLHYNCPNPPMLTNPRRWGMVYHCNSLSL